MPSQNVLFVTWTCPSIRMVPLRRDGFGPPDRASSNDSVSAAAGEETREVPTAATAPHPDCVAHRSESSLSCSLASPFIKWVHFNGRPRWLRGVEHTEEHLPGSADVATGGGAGRGHSSCLNGLHDGLMLVPDLLSVGSPVEHHRHDTADMPPLAVHHVDDDLVACCLVQRGMERHVP